jgi:phosphoribosylanthranilate isomerase
MQHPDPLRFAAVIDQFAPDWVQTDIADFAGLTVPAGTRGLPVLREGETVAADDLPARLVFEGRISGSGATADWQQAKSLSARTELILAGGLNADNIGAAIATVQPFGVDVSSGVEYERGRKDPRKIREFVARVRALES